MNIAAVVLIVVLDWMTPAGVVVGILLAIPITAASMSDDRRHLWFVFGLAATGKVLAAALGAAPISPLAVWMPNRIFAFLTLPATLFLSLKLQSIRIDAERARDVNRILRSLLAHDLRAPLVMAHDGMQYVESSVQEARPVDLGIIADIRARLVRSLGMVEVLLDLARDEMAGRSHRFATSSDPAAVIETEISGYMTEARERGKELLIDISGCDRENSLVDGPVLRQALSILIDNAIRHAVPGPVRVTVFATKREVIVRVADSGPGLPTVERVRTSDQVGAGLGLELCRALARHAGGSLRIEKNGPDGTTFALHLPLRRAVGQRPPLHHPELEAHSTAS